MPQLLQIIVPLFFGLFFIFFLFIFGTVIYAIFKRRKVVANSPRLTVYGTVVAKRTMVSGHRHRSSHAYSSTFYYVTFEVESGDRMELSVSPDQSGQIVEGDKGRVTFKANILIDFVRE